MYTFLLYFFVAGARCAAAADHFSDVLLHIHYCYVVGYFMYVYVFSCILLVPGVRCAATADDSHEAGCCLYTFFDVADYYMHVYLLCWGVVAAAADECHAVGCRTYTCDDEGCCMYSFG